MKMMKPEAVWKLLEGHADILTPAKKQEEQRANHARCPLCESIGGALFIPPNQPFLPNSVLPNYHTKCEACGTTFNPMTGLITKAGPHILTTDPE